MGRDNNLSYGFTKDGQTVYVDADDPAEMYRRAQDGWEPDRPVEAEMWGKKVALGRASDIVSTMTAGTSRIRGDEDLENARANRIREDDASGIGGKTVALLTGIGDAASLGGTKLIRKGFDLETEKYRDMLNYNPGTYTAGQIIGMLTPTGRGAGALSTASKFIPAAAASRLGASAAAKWGTGAIARGAISGAVEGAVGNTAMTTASMIAENRPLTVEALLAAPLVGGALGGTLGAAFPAAGQLLGKARGEPDSLGILGGKVDDIAEAAAMRGDDVADAVSGAAGGAEAAGAATMRSTRLNAVTGSTKAGRETVAGMKDQFDTAEGFIKHLDDVMETHGATMAREERNALFGLKREMHDVMRGPRGKTGIRAVVFDKLGKGKQLSGSQARSLAGGMERLTKKQGEVLGLLGAKATREMGEMAADVSRNFARLADEAASGMATSADVLQDTLGRLGVKGKHLESAAPAMVRGSDEYVATIGNLNGMVQKSDTIVAKGLGLADDPVAQRLVAKAQGTRAALDDAIGGADNMVEAFANSAQPNVGLNAFSQHQRAVKDLAAHLGETFDTLTPVTHAAEKGGIGAMDLAAASEALGVTSVTDGIPGAKLLASAVALRRLGLQVAGGGAMGKLLEGGAIGAVSGRLASALGKAKDVAAKAAGFFGRGVTAVAPYVARSSVAILNNVIHSPAAGGRGKDLKTPAGAFARKSADVTRAHTDPELVRESTHAILGSVATSFPELVIMAADKAQQRVGYLFDKMPKPPDFFPLGRGGWSPSRSEINTWARHVDAAENPLGVLQRIDALTPEGAETIRTLYPEIFGEFQRNIVANAATLQNKMNRRQRYLLGMLMDAPLDATQTLDYAAAMQGNFAQPGAPAAVDPLGGHVTQDARASRAITAEPATSADRAAGRSR